MKLSHFEAGLLCALKLDADIPLKQVAEKLGKSVSTVRAAVADLEEREVIRFYPLVNVHRLGYSLFLLYFTPVAAQEEALLRSLKEHSHVSWFARFSSDLHKYCASFVCRSPLHYSTIISELGAQHGACFHSSATQIQINLTLFNPKHLLPEEIDLGSVSVKAEGPVVQIDERDNLILSGLLHHRYSSIRDLARQLDVAHSTVHERVNFFKQSGILERFTYLPNISAVGLDVYRALIKARSLHPDVRKEFFEFCRHHPLITVLLECFGTWDFEIGLESPDRSSVDAAISVLTKQFGKLIEVVDVMKREERTKDTCYPFYHRP
jgi:Lrp/AsnC family transcriptional regulator for asnA, asnC and gidA